jgi:predicted CXXCH cytochrome family protein
MLRRILPALVPFFALLLGVLCSSTASAQSKPNGCAVCHASLPQPALAAPPKAMTGDVHDKAGVRCADCHGGNPAASEQARAHDTARDFRAEPSGAAICSRCHALVAERFATSAHAATFDTFACVECHGNHGVPPPSDSLIGTSREAICANCHSDKDDPGFVAAGAMRASLDRLRQGIDAGTEVIARVRNAGMEVSDQELALNEARSKLIMARMEIHASNPATLDPIVDDGMTIVAAVDRAGQQASAELGFRRRGLFVSLGVILVFVVALTLKIRKLNRRRGPVGR